MFGHKEKIQSPLETEPAESEMNILYATDSRKEAGKYQHQVILFKDARDGYYKTAYQYDGSESGDMGKRLDMMNDKPKAFRGGTGALEDFKARARESARNVSNNRDPEWYPNSDQPLGLVYQRVYHAQDEEI